ncbi:unnamed protein product [Ectocarpus sp. 4 AP-2014]
MPLPAGKNDTRTAIEDGLRREPTQAAITEATLTPFQKALADSTRRRELTAKREKALQLRQSSKVDVQTLIARDGCLSQHENDRHLVRDPQLYLRWTPIYPHPLPMSYELFENERELRRLAVLPPEDRVLAAAAAGRAWCVEELFAQGCPIKGKHGSGFTALHVAAMRNDPNTVRVLLNMKVDVNSTNMSGATPLSCAMGGAGGPGGECATLLRASGGLVRLVKDTISPGSILDVPLRRPRRATDDRADALGRMVYTGQF